MKKLFFLIALLPGLSKTYCQNTIGIPDIINYSKSSYNAGTQNRGIVQDKNGVMYFANYEGLLTFDGTFWKIYPLPNKIIVRSLAIGADNKIYVGCQGDIGYFSPDTRGMLTYHSLRSLIPAQEKTFTEVWETVAFGADVFFRSRDKIFQFTNNTISVFPAPLEWRFLGKANNRLIAQDAKMGLLEFNKGLWEPLVDAQYLPAECIVSSVSRLNNDSIFVTTINSGLFILSGKTVSKFKFKHENPFTNQRILTATPINDDWIAIGTNLQGCFIIDKEGNVIQNLSRKEGLQLNNILYLFVDKHRNLWLGLDNGIDFIAINNEIKHIYPEHLNEGEGYTSIIYKNKLYVGTSNGLYSVPLSNEKDFSLINGSFKSIPNTSGSSWNLTEINGQLLLGHHDGSYQVEDDRVVPVKEKASYSYWTFLPFHKVLPSSLVLAGTSLGLDFLKFENGKFVFSNSVNGYSKSSQFVAIDNNNFVWTAHPYRGVFRLDLTHSGEVKEKLYTEKNGLPSLYNNHLFKIKNRIVVATEAGVYEYNASTDRFQPSSFFKNTLGGKNIRHLKEDASGNVWFVEDKNLGVIDYSSGKAEMIYFPELDGTMVAGYENIYPYNKQNIFVGAEKGFYHINYENYKRKTNTNIHVQVTSVNAFGTSDSLLFGGYFGEVNQAVSQSRKSIPEIPDGFNSLHFEFSAPVYEHHNSVVYSFLLKGYDEKWSEWTRKTEKDYTNLAGGNYTFQVKARNNLGNESEITAYTVTVLPPWYKTTHAYIIYIILFIAFNYLFFKKLKSIFLRQKQKHEEQQKHLQYMHHLELEKSEKEIVALRNEKLQAELKNKNTELASATMHLVQKGDLLSKVKEELTKSKKNSGELAPEEIKKLIRAIKEEDNLDEEWNQFATHFDTVHVDFLHTLKRRFRNLTPNELKLCAYLHMNLSSKEIAQHMKISVRGVEISRYRLRKKLQIPTETNLFDFLLEVAARNVHGKNNVN